MRPEFYAEYFEIEDRHWWFVGRRRVILAVLDDHLGAGDRRVLDVGCGTGTMLGHLARYGQAEGLDADPAAVEFCRRRGVERISLLPEGGTLPAEDGSFGLVTALDVIEHVDDDAGLLAEMGRVLEPGGTLLLTVPAYRFLWGAQDEISHHRRRYVRPQLVERVAGAGLEVRRASYFNTLLFPPIAAVRLLRRGRPPKDELRSDFSMTKEGPVNTALGRLFGAEAGVVRRASLPFGVSILCLAVKPLS